MEQVFIANEKLVQKVANKFAVAYNKDFEEVYSEACMAFVKYYPNWQEGRAAFSTYMWLCMWGSLQNWARTTEVAHVEYDDECFGVEEEVYHEEIDRSTFTEAAEMAIELAVGSFSDAVNEKRCNIRSVRAAIQRTMRELGYPQRKIDAAFDEIAKALV